MDCGRVARSLVGEHSSAQPARDVTAAVRLSQRGADCAVDLVGAAGTATLGDDLAIDPFQVFRFEPIQAVLADLGDQVPANRDLVRRVTRRPQVRPSDVLQPMIQPRGHSPSLARSPNLTLIACPFQVADLPHDDTLGLAHNVPTVDGPVVAVANSHPTVPEAVTSLVDRGRTVRVRLVTSLRLVGPSFVAQPPDVFTQALGRDPTQPT